VYGVYGALKLTSGKVLQLSCGLAFMFNADSAALSRWVGCHYAVASAEKFLQISRSKEVEKLLK